MNEFIGEKKTPIELACPMRRWCIPRNEIMLEVKHLLNIVKLPALTTSSKTHSRAFWDLTTVTSESCVLGYYSISAPLHPDNGCCQCTNPTQTR